MDYDYAEREDCPMNIKIDDMSWPYPDSGLEWSIRYGKPTVSELYQAASIISAYRQMIFDPQEKRQMVIREIRKATKEIL